MMKKKVLFLVLGVFMTLGLTSCGKDYTCTCTYTIPGATTTSSSSALYENVRKSKAEEACDALDATIKAAYGNAAGCSLN